MRTKIRRTLTGAALVAALLTPGVAQATPPGPGVTGRVIAEKTVGDTDYVLREIVIPPGQDTGWHYHDGMVYGLITGGTLSHFDSSCASDGVYPTGTTIAEQPDHTHIGRNLGTEPLVIQALYVLPHGAPYSQDAARPACDAG
ncbi:cupin domain-containing protein [Streptomyces sp. B6B3]|jgi:quercetin dioxygenase-like cupin family protein|uniref:cupin domain-containing protein n=1 Tax=Streptomyces sp. B6B3 TaxID=3153570 RepID=UPI00325DE196